MNNKKVEERAFFWALQGLCALHRKPFSIELARQQLAAPHTTESLQRAAGAFGFVATPRKVAPGKLHEESFPLVAWLHPKAASEEAHASSGQEEHVVDGIVDTAVPALILQADAGHILLVESDDASPRTVPFAEFATRYLGHLAQVQSQYAAHRKAYLDALDQEKALLDKAEHERKSAIEILAKLEQTLPSYQRSAQAYARLEKDGFVGGIAAAEKQREATEKAKDLDAQRSTVAALDATIAAQQKKISQLQSSYKSDLQKELSDIKTRVAQLQPNLDKSIYKEGLMELKAPQDGIIKDLATTTVGAVVQPGTVLMTPVPLGEQLYADVNIKNEDVGFVQVNQTVLEYLLSPVKKAVAEAAHER